ncbi:MAG: hypothetical protein H7832_13830 [Magnetococcus sp. DMHC-6]
MHTNDGLIHAILLDGQGGGQTLTWSETKEWSAETGFLWLHLQLDKPQARAWIEQETILDTVLTEVLTDDDNHPRIVWEEDVLFGTLRGVNRNGQSNPDGMIFVNFWIDSQRAITVRMTPVQAIQEISQEFQTGRGPTGPGELLTRILDHLHDHLEPTLEEIETELDDYYEQALIFENADSLREKLIAVRHEIIELRRFLAPQKAALSALSKTSPPLAPQKTSPGDSGDRNPFTTVSWRSRELSGTGHGHPRRNQQPNSRTHQQSHVLNLYFHWNIFAYGIYNRIVRH